MVPTFFPLNLQFFAHKKAGSSAATNCNHDSHSKSRGVKRGSSQRVRAGGIIVTQLGSKFLPGPGTYISSNYTIHAQKDGRVSFLQKKIRHHSRTFVSVS